MSWAHIIIEGYCLHNEEREAAGAKRPNWCVKKFGKGEKDPSVKCLFGVGKKESRCPFLGCAPIGKDDQGVFEATAWAIGECSSDEEGHKIRGAKKRLTYKIIEAAENIRGGQ